MLTAPLWTAAVGLFPAAIYVFGFVRTDSPIIDLRRVIALLEDRRQGVNLAPTSVASTFEVGVLDDRIAARLSVRHALNAFLLQQGGHIGYCVLPEFRGRGLGTAALQRGLEITAGLGINPTLVTCDEDNPASRHIIERAGGRYESSYSGPDAAVPIRRYWFESR